RNARTSAHKRGRSAAARRFRSCGERIVGRIGTLAVSRAPAECEVGLMRRNSVLRLPEHLQSIGQIEGGRRAEARGIAIADLIAAFPRRRHAALRADAEIAGAGILRGTAEIDD